jgi:hypothetical protein
MPTFKWLFLKIIAYTPEAMREGSMWWWILPLAPDVPEHRAKNVPRISQRLVNTSLGDFNGSFGSISAVD